MDDEDKLDLMIEKINELVEKINDMNKFCILKDELISLYKQKIELLEQKNANG